MALNIISHIIKNEIYEYLDELDVLGCDGTVINTVWKLGVIRQIEQHVGRLVQ